MSEQTETPQASWLIGSSSECDQVINKPVVSGLHCRLSQYDKGFVLEDVGSTNGTFVNGHRLVPNEPVWVSQQDRITLGQALPMPWPNAEMPRREGRPGGKRGITIGRAPDSDVQLDYSMISWNHARIVEDGKQYILEDLDSTNGTSVNRIDNKVKRAVLQPTDEIYLGSYKIAVSRILTEKHITQGESAFELVNLRGDHMVLGRDPTCDYPLDYPMISWRHAEIEKTPQGMFVQDLGSRNGTYVNGVRIGGRIQVKPGQEIGLGSFRFQILESGSLAKREYKGNVTIEVSQVAVNAPDGTRLLDPISLTIFPSELVALMGPAGAGKTTFLKALNGYTPPAEGRVLFNGEDLYQFYDRFRQQMGYVPQDDIVHPQLTVREALYYSAKLRTDLTDDEIEKRIDLVLNSLGILDKKNAIIGSPEKKVLSGGQRKRVNIAMELINDTPVIFLDEPTSGLSSYDAQGVVRLLKQLSKEGKTIITTIHQPSLDIFQEFDNLIMISRDKGGCGALAYFGPAYPDAIEFFDPAGCRAVRAQPGKELSPEMLLSGLATRKTADWAAEYERSTYKKNFVADRSGKNPATPVKGSEKAVRRFDVAQWITLMRRNVILKMRDRMQSLLLLAQAPLFAALVGLVFSKIKGNTNLPELAGQLVGLHFLLVVAAIWFGCNNAARDVVGEWTVYQRERMVSLKLPSYVFSKVAIAGALCLFQCLVLLGIVNVACGLKGNFWEALGVLFLASMVGVALGLLISANAPTTESAIALLPLVLLPMIALGGGILPVHKMEGLMPKVTMVVPSRWAFEANMVREGIERGKVTFPGETEPRDLANSQFPENKRNKRSTAPLVLSGMLLVSLAGVIASLKRRDIQ